MRSAGVKHQRILCAFHIPAREPLSVRRCGRHGRLKQGVSRHNLLDADRLPCKRCIIIKFIPVGLLLLRGNDHIHRKGGSLKRGSLLHIFRHDLRITAAIDVHNIKPASRFHTGGSDFHRHRDRRLDLLTVLIIKSNIHGTQLRDGTLDSLADHFLHLTGCDRFDLHGHRGAAEGFRLRRDMYQHAVGITIEVQQPRCGLFLGALTLRFLRGFLQCGERICIGHF